MLDSFDPHLRRLMLERSVGKEGEFEIEKSEEIHFTFPLRVFFLQIRKMRTREKIQRFSTVKEFISVRF